MTRPAAPALRMGIVDPEMARSSDLSPSRTITHHARRGTVTFTGRAWILNSTFKNLQKSLCAHEILVVSTFIQEKQLPEVLGLKRLGDTAEEQIWEERLRRSFLSSACPRKVFILLMGNRVQYTQSANLKNNFELFRPFNLGLAHADSVENSYPLPDKRGWDVLELERPLNQYLRAADCYGYAYFQNVHDQMLQLGEQAYRFVPLARGKSSDKIVAGAFEFYDKWVICLPRLKAPTLKDLDALYEIGVHFAQRDAHASAVGPLAFKEFSHLNPRGQHVPDPSAQRIRKESAELDMLLYVDEARGGHLFTLHINGRKALKGTRLESGIQRSPGQLLAWFVAMRAVADANSASAHLRQARLSGVGLPSAVSRLRSLIAPHSAWIGGPTKSPLFTPPVGAKYRAFIATSFLQKLRCPI